MRPHLVRSFLAACACLLASGAASATASFSWIDFLPGATYDISPSISGDGRVVVSTQGSSFPGFGDLTPVRWEAGTVTAIPGLNSIHGGKSPTDVSFDGSVVIINTEALVKAIRWENGAITFIDDLPGVIFGDNVPIGLSADGAVIVGRSGNEAYRWEAGVISGLGYLPGGFSSRALGTSADGNIIIGVSESTAGDEAFRWVGGVMTGLGGLESAAIDISADGSVIVGENQFEVGFGEAFRWEGGLMSGIGFLPGGAFSTAVAVSADGSVIVGSSQTTESDSTAFIWTADSGMQNLAVLLTDLGVDLAGWQLQGAADVSDDGQTIVGTASDSSGSNRVWRAVIPEPSTGLLLGCGLLSLAACRRGLRSWTTPTS